MTKRSRDEPGDKASERLKQLYEARFPNATAGESLPGQTPPETGDTPAKKKAPKKTASKKSSTKKK